MHSMRTKKGRAGYMAVKIDLEKTYDKVHWPFLRRLLHHIGFSNNMVEIIMYSIMLTSLSVTWNGQFLEPFSL